MPVSGPQFSVVVPFYNEEGAAFGVLEELCRELAKLGREWECLAVDDGSRDGTHAALLRAHALFPQCRVIRLPANCGQGGALLAGIQQARAPVIGMMDGDGQNMPADFVRMLPLLENADLVVGIRASRNDSALRKFCSRVANRVRGSFLHDGVSDAGCAIKVFRREVIKSFFPVTMLNPFMPAFAAAAGFRIVELPVGHRPRTSGVSKYGLSVILWRPMCDMLAIWWTLKRRIPVERLPIAASDLNRE